MTSKVSSKALPKDRSHAFEKASTPKPFLHNDQTLIIGIGHNAQGTRVYICPLCNADFQTRSSFCRHAGKHDFPLGSTLFYSVLEIVEMQSQSRFILVYSTSSTDHCFSRHRNRSRPSSSGSSSGSNNEPSGDSFS